MNIGLLFGGKSVEHEISILTALEVFCRIDEKVYLIYASKNQEYYLADQEILKKYKNPEKYYRKINFINGGIKSIKKIKIDFMFILNHGYYGEDGMSYSLCKLHNIKCIGSNNIISGICCRKDYLKKLTKEKTLDFCYVDYNSKVTYPCIIKPADLGSSIGINVVRNDEEFKKALDEAYRYSNVVICEKYLEDAREFNCAVCFDKVSNVFEVSNGFLDYEKKYINQNKSVIINNELSELIKEESKRIYKEFQFSGVIRIDYLYKDDVIYLNEINVVPGSLSYYMFDFDIFKYLIKMTNKEYEKDNLIKCYDSSIFDLKIKK